MIIYQTRKFTKERIKTYSLNEILTFIRENPEASHYVDDEGNECKLRRAKIYFAKGVDCKHCSVTGAFFSLEKWMIRKNVVQFHFELYGVNELGEEVLMTIDHIHPKSKGGQDTLDNYDPLCIECNVQKGNKTL